MPHVFVSYVRESQEDVDRLCRELTKHGVKVWLDRNDIKPGSRWKDAIREAIQQGDFFIACFSEKYQRRDKTFMNEELALAVEELRKYRPGRPWFIPVLFEDCDVPSFSISDRETLLDIQWVLLFLDWDVGIQRILDVIQPIPPDVQGLIAALNLDYDAVRKAAAEALGNKPHNRAIQALIKALNDENEEVETIAGDALVQIGESAIFTLTNALNDEEQIVNIRTVAAYLLGEIGDPRAVSALINALNDEDEDDIRIGTAWALGDIGDSTAVPALINALSDENATVRQFAVSALWNISTPEALKAVEEYENRPKGGDS